MRGERVPTRTLVPPEGVVRRESSDFLAIEDEEVAGAVQHIWQCVGDAVTVHGVCDHLHFSRNTLIRKFREALRRTPSDEVRRSWIDTAKRLLSATDLPLGRVALDSGYGQQPQLNRAVKAATGQTPAEYRLHHRRGGGVTGGRVGGGGFVAEVVPHVGVVLVAVEVFDDLIAAFEAWRQAAVEVCCSPRGAPATLSLVTPSGDSDMLKPVQLPPMLLAVLLLATAVSATGCRTAEVGPTQTPTQTVERGELPPLVPPEFDEAYQRQETEGRGTGLVYGIETRFLTYPVDALREAGVEVDSEPYTIAPGEFNTVIVALQGRGVEGTWEDAAPGDMGMFTVPRLSAYSGRRAFVVIARQIAYQPGATDTQAGEGVMPEVEVIQNGVAVMVEAEVVDEGHVRLTHLEPRRTQVLEVRRTDVVYANGNPVEEPWVRLHARVIEGRTLGEEEVLIIPLRVSLHSSPNPLDNTPPSDFKADERTVAVVRATVYTPDEVERVRDF